MERRKDHKERADYPTSYEEYKGSVQEENEDRAFLGFNKRNGIKVAPDHVRIVEAVLVIACLTAIVGTIVWVVLF